MKKILLVIISLFAITGCTDIGEEMVKDLNKSVETEIAKWEDRGYATTFTMDLIEKGLENKDYVLIAIGDKEFLTAPDKTEFTEEVKDYTGILFSKEHIVEKRFNMAYVVVYDKNKEKYYNIKFTMEEKDFKETQREYPKFSNSNRIK